MRTAVVRAGRSKPLWLGHPWVYADSIASIDAGEDDFVRVADADGKTIGRAWYSPRSAIRLRMLDRGEPDASEDEVVAARVEAAVALRRRLFRDERRTNAYRLVHAEADGLPGLVVDRYADVLVAQFSTRPLHLRRERLAALLLRTSGASSLVARPGGKEAEEGIPPEDVPFAAGDPAPDRREVLEEGLVFAVDLRAGQKTGGFLDQRENRAAVARVASGARVLDLCCGNGGFSVHALAAGAASARGIDSSGPALALARENAARNGVGDRFQAVEADVLDALAALRDARETFDVVVLDPPRFASSRAALPRALHAYRDRNARAFARVAPGGFLATFSCSGLLDPEGFQALVRSAARDSGREAAVLAVLSAGPDHPVGLAAPEGRYLTGLLLRVS
jgi:23S rRNA (cytosine1962-C5)-methyltransferase